MQLRKKLEQVEKEHKDLKRAYFQLSLRQKNEKDGGQVLSPHAISWRRGRIENEAKQSRKRHMC